MVRNERLRVGIIFGGRSGEHEVSLMSAASVLSVLDKRKYEIVQIGISHDGVWLSGTNVLEALSDGNSAGLEQVTLPPDPIHQGLYKFVSRENLRKVNPLELVQELDIVFPVLHGTYGEDGALQGLLEMADIPYVGAGVLGSAVGMDKGVFRDVMIANDIPVVESLLVLRSRLESELDEILEYVESIGSYPLFVKPANLGSSVGVTKCRARSDMIEGLMEAAQYDRRVLVQRAVNAREIEVSVLGNDSPIASVPGEIIPSREFYSYEAKYLDGESELLIPAPLDEDTTQFAQELALRAYTAVDCAGMARVDFFLDKDTGELLVNELNTIPGFTKISMYPKLWEASGISYPELINRLIEFALERKSDREKTSRRYTAE